MYIYIYTYIYIYIYIHMYVYIYIHIFGASPRRSSQQAGRPSGARSREWSFEAVSSPHIIRYMRIPTFVWNAGFPFCLPKHPRVRTLYISLPVCDSPCKQDHKFPDREIVFRGRATPAPLLWQPHLPAQGPPFSEPT